MVTPRPAAEAEPQAAARPPSSPCFVFRLYIAGLTPRSTQAVQNLRNFCEAHLAGRYELEVVDLYQQPHLAQADHILAIPTLIRKLPLPPRQFFGDLSEPRALLAGLGLEPATPS
jgi:circadian clock protein KaiB